MSSKRPSLGGITIGEWIRRRRESLQLSLSQVHLRTNGQVNVSTLSKVERGERPASPEMLIALAPVLRVDLEDLYRIAGLLPGASKSVEHEPIAFGFREALKSDPNLTEAEKRAMQQLYETFVTRRPRNADK